MVRDAASAPWVAGLNVLPDKSIHHFGHELQLPVLFLELFELPDVIGLQTFVLFLPASSDTESVP